MRLDWTFKVVVSDDMACGMRDAKLVTLESGDGVLELVEFVKVQAKQKASSPRQLKERVMRGHLVAIDTHADLKLVQ